MIDEHPNDLDRLLELMAKEASGGISIDESAERDELLRAHPDVDRDEMLEVAALTQLAFLKKSGSENLKLPDHLKRKIVDRGRAAVAGSPRQDNIVSFASATRAESAPSKQPSNAGSMSGRLGWAAAAALALVLLVDRVIMPNDSRTTDLAAQVASLNTAPGTLTAAWQTPDALGFENVAGKVIWNSEQQRGYMLLSGMPVNRPGQSQYQLWIVAPSRDANPVDGGVFDVLQTNGDIIVPINAKLFIEDPKAFAITREQPGGVVVSKGPLLVVAPIST